MKITKNRKKCMSGLSIILVLNLFSVLITAGVNASDSDFRNFYAIAWRGKASDNIRYAKQMGYHYVAYQYGMEFLPEAANTKFYLVDPEYRVSPLPISFDRTAIYSPETEKVYEALFVWKNNAALFPDNIATGWWYNDHVHNLVLDFQQQSVIDTIVEAIISKARTYENPETGFLFGGLMWDVPDLRGDFWNGPKQSGGMTIGLEYWTGMDSCASSSHTHDYATYSDGRANFFKQMYKRMKEEFPDAKTVAHPHNIYYSWMEVIIGRDDSAELMPDMLTQEGLGTNFADDYRIFDSGLITKSHIGVTTPIRAGDDNERLYAAKAAINAGWFGWFGAFGADASVNFSNIYEVPAKSQLIRALPNWDNLVNVPLSKRLWDGTVYESPNSYADSNIIYSRQPDSRKIFCVFLNTSGRIKLFPGEEVISVHRTDGFFIESADGSSDVSIIDNEIKLLDISNVKRGYIILTSDHSIPSPPPHLVVN